MIDANQVEEALVDILSQEEYLIYYEDNRHILQILRDRLVEWINELLARLFSSFQPSGTVGDLIISFLLLIATLLVLILIFILTRKYIKKRYFKSFHPLNASAEQLWECEDHLREVKRLEDEGNKQQAVRHLFLALLLRLDKEGLLIAHKWKTNWEYYQEMQRTNKKNAKDFYQLALFFEDVNYGEKKVYETTYQTYRNTITQWLEQLKNMNTTEEEVEG